MSKTIVIRLKKAGSRGNIFSIKDSLGNVLATNVTKSDLISGLSFIVEDNVFYVTISSLECCNAGTKIVLSSITNQELANLEFNTINTGSLWKHLTNTTIYNKYYDCTYPYIIEYPFTYQYQDEILQNIIDYTKSYIYLSSVTGVFDDNRKIQVDDRYFTSAILYNDQQSSGKLNLIVHPVNNMKVYLSYPKFNIDSKDILYTKSDSFYQFNTFWDIVIDKTDTLFLTSCKSMSIDKEINQENMDYSSRSFKKYPLRAKDLKVRMILDDSDVHLVSNFVITPSQISYK